MQLFIFDQKETRWKFREILMLIENKKILNRENIAFLVPYHTETVSKIVYRECTVTRRNAEFHFTARMYLD